MAADPSRAAEEGRALVRRALSAFDDVVERPSHGEAAWFVDGKRQVAWFADRHHDNRVAAWLAVPPGVQESLVAAQPDRYFRPPYVGHRGWVGVYLDGAFDPEEVAGLLAMAVAHVRAMSMRRRR